MTNKNDSTNIPIDSCSIDLSGINKQNPPDNYEFDIIASRFFLRQMINTYVFFNIIQVIKFNFLHFDELFCGTIDNDSYRVYVESHSQIKCFMGEQMEGCIIEKWFDCKVNGVIGWGAAEWQYKTEQNIPKY